MPVQSDDVTAAYRLVLGREPALQSEIDEGLGARSLARLAYRLLNESREFEASGRRAIVFGPPRTGLPAPGDAGPPGTQERVPRELVAFGYRFLLGRPPESEAVVADKARLADELEVLRSFVLSPEFAEVSRHWAEDFGGPDEDPPLPPMRLRRQVGPTDRALWSNPSGQPLFGDAFAIESYRRVFDFGCGAGRVARQLIQQKQPPVRYVGVDLNREAIEWCNENISSSRPHFEFHHLDVHNPAFNPAGTRQQVDFPTGERFSLVNAHSVFTHITQPNVGHYLSECGRVLEDDGILRSTWFLFDKSGFPMMQEFQNALYINLDDPTNATIFDYRWVEALFAERGLVIWRILPPAVRGFQWTLFASHRQSGRPAAAFPEDRANVGIVRPPV